MVSTLRVLAAGKKEASNTLPPALPSSLLLLCKKQETKKTENGCLAKTSHTPFNYSCVWSNTQGKKANKRGRVLMRGTAKWLAESNPCFMRGPITQADVFLALKTEKKSSLVSVFIINRLQHILPMRYNNSREQQPRTKGQLGVKAIVTG